MTGKGKSEDLFLMTQGEDDLYNVIGLVRCVKDVDINTEYARYRATLPPREWDPRLRVVDMAVFAQSLVDNGFMEWVACTEIKGDDSYETPGVFKLGVEDE